MTIKFRFLLLAYALAAKLCIENNATSFLPQNLSHNFHVLRGDDVLMFSSVNISGNFYFSGFGSTIIEPTLANIPLSEAECRELVSKNACLQAIFYLVNQGELTLAEVSDERYSFAPFFVKNGSAYAVMPINFRNSGINIFNIDTKQTLRQVSTGATSVEQWIDVFRNPERWIP